MDAKGEFAELYNSGSVAISLSGWILKTENGKKFSLAGRSVPAHGYLLLPRSTTKLPLRNTDGGLFLYGPGGALVDSGNFLGTAPEGQSFSRIDYRTGPAQHFAFVDPTPGAPNKTMGAAIAVNEYPRGIPLSRPLENSQFFAIMMGTAALITGLLIYVIRSNEDLSKLFLEGDKKTG